MKYIKQFESIATNENFLDIFKKKSPYYNAYKEAEDYIKKKGPEAYGKEEGRAIEHEFNKKFFKYFSGGHKKTGWNTDLHPRYEPTRVLTLKEVKEYIKHGIYKLIEDKSSNHSGWWDGKPFKGVIKLLLDSIIHPMNDSDLSQCIKDSFFNVIFYMESKWHWSENEILWFYVKDDAYEIIYNMIKKIIDDDPSYFKEVYEYSKESEIRAKLVNEYPELSRDVKSNLWGFTNESLDDMYNRKFFQILKNDIINFSSDKNILGTYVYFYAKSNDFGPIKIYKPEEYLHTGFIIKCDFWAHKKLSENDTNQYAMTKEEIIEKTDEIYQYIKDKLQDFDVKLTEREITIDNRFFLHTYGDINDKQFLNKINYRYKILLEMSINLQDWANRSDTTGLWDTKIKNI